MFSTPSLPLSPLEQAKKRIENAFLAAFIAAGLTVFVAISTAISQEDTTPLLWMGDAALVLMLGLGIRRKSRVCAALLVLYWIFSKWISWQQIPPGSVGIFVGASFWFCFISGLGGAIYFHRHHPRENSMAMAVAAGIPET